MAALSIVLFCVQTGHDFHSFVLCLAPIELFVAFLKISEILRRKNLPTRRQKLFRICTSSQVLDSLAICIASLLFFSVRFVSSFKYTFSIGPVVLSTTIIVLKAAFSKKEVPLAEQNEGETFGAIFLTILRIFLVLQLGNFLLKMDGFVEFSWKEVYWPFWIFFSILIGLSFSIFLIMVTKLCAFVVLVTPFALTAQNLLPNPGFETGTVQVCTQGELPAPWVQASNTNPGADTWAIDCSTMGGTQINQWGHFPPGFLPHGGQRFGPAQVPAFHQPSKGPFRQEPV